MHNTFISLLFTAILGATALGAHAQTASDLSRYESIYETHKASKAPAHPVPHGIQPGKTVETIGPSSSQVIVRSSGLGMSEAPQPVVRPGVPMMAGGTVSVAPGIVDKVAPQPASNADLPVPKKRTTEMITEDAKGEVIERSTVTR